MMTHKSWACDQDSEPDPQFTDETLIGVSIRKARAINSKIRSSVVNASDYCGVRRPGSAIPTMQNQIQCQIGGVGSANGSPIKTYGVSWHRVTLQHSNERHDFDWPFIIADCSGIENGATLHGSGVAFVSTDKAYALSTAAPSRISHITHKISLPSSPKARPLSFDMKQVADAEYERLRREDLQALARTFRLPYSCSAEAQL
ncbi:hypothetical protein Ciccas_002410 [Cichlidogyrus casuarinus]|uniref:Uncharacterized protein n=1 Tax=Cichlidogyrus casuarinus TaxID=1844966 RepID=A0ABD2QH92_9PLAT